MCNISHVRTSDGLVGLPQNEGAVVIAHCGGAFDFQILYCQLLDAAAKHVHTKKLKPPLLCQSKIVCAEIHNKILLLDSYMFVTAALVKFPGIFNIEEKKKGFFPHVQLSGILELSWSDATQQLLQTRHLSTSKKSGILQAVQ